MIAELKAELFPRIVAVGKEFLDLCVTYEEVERPGVVRKTVFERRHVQDLVEPGIV
jgi:hypothetical protein